MNKRIARSERTLDLRDPQANDNAVVRLLSRPGKRLQASGLVILAHVAYVLLWITVGGASPAAAERVVHVGWPVTWFVLWLHPQLHGLYSGAMSSGFYDGVGAEGLFAGGLTSATMAALWLARYGNQPWRYVGAIRQRSGRGGVALAAIGSLPLAALAGFLFCAFYGFSSDAALTPARAGLALTQVCMSVSVLGFCGVVVLTGVAGFWISLAAASLRAMFRSSRNDDFANPR